MFFIHLQRTLRPFSTTFIADLFLFPKCVAYYRFHYLFHCRYLFYHFMVHYLITLLHIIQFVMEKVLL